MGIVCPSGPRILDQQRGGGLFTCRTRSTELKRGWTLGPTPSVQPAGDLDPATLQLLPSAVIKLRCLTWFFVVSGVFLDSLGFCFECSLITLSSICRPAVEINAGRFVAIGLWQGLRGRPTSQLP